MVIEPNSLSCPLDKDIMGVQWLLTGKRAQSPELQKLYYNDFRDRFIFNDHL